MVSGATEVFDGSTAPLLIVEIANVNPSGDASTTSQYFILDRSQLGIGKLAGSDTIWDAIASDVIGISIRRGRSKEIDPIQPGTATITVDNESGDYDPTNLSGRFSTNGQTNLLPNRQIRVIAHWNNVDYYLYRGYIDSFDPDFGSYPTTTFNCVDAFSLFAQDSLGALATPAYGGDTTGARINRVLDAIGWPSTLRKIDTGLTVMPDTSYGDTALNLIQEAATAENGRCFIDGAGNVVFEDRHALYNNPTASTVQVAFTDDSTAVDFESLKSTYGAGQIYNVIHVTRDGGTEQVTSDSQSQTNYGKRDYQVSGLKVQTDTDALYYAQFLLGKWKDPDFRVTEVDAEAVGQSSSSWASICGLDLGYLVSIHRDYANNGGFTKQLLVEGLNIDIAPDPASWKITLATSAANRADVIVLDVGPGLDTGRLGY